MAALLREDRRAFLMEVVGRRLWPMALLAVPLLSTCSNEPTAPASAPFHMLLTLSDQAITPGGSVVITVSVQAPADQKADSLKIRLSGLLSDSLAMAVPVSGSFGYNIIVSTPHGPIAGTVHVVAILRIGVSVDSALAGFRVIDDGPPWLDAAFLRWPGPDDTMRVLYRASDASGITQATWHVHGAVEYLSGETFFNYPAEVSGVFKLFLPRSLRLGDSVVVDVEVWDSFGETTSFQLSVTAKDVVPPAVTTVVSPGPYDSLLPWRASAHFTGDTVRMTVRATDNYRVAWLGWRMAPGLGDSVAVHDTSATATFQLPVTAAMDGPGHALTFFARDSVGNEGGRQVTEDFVDATRRVLQPIAAVPNRSPAEYLAYAQQPHTALVEILGYVYVFSTQPFSLLKAVGTPGNNFGLDVAPGADTAWVGSYTGELDAIELRTAPPAVARRLQVTAPYYLTGLRLLPGNRAFISGTSGTIVDPGAVTLVDLGAGVQRQRQISNFPRNIATSGDRTLLLGFDGVGRVVPYYPAADSFGTARAVAAGTPSLDERGDLVLISNRLYDGSLQLLRSVGPPKYDGQVSIISADGQFAYFRMWPGLHKLRISDGTLVEKAFAPVTSGMLELPDLSMILVVDDMAFTLVDFSPSGILPVANR